MIGVAGGEGAMGAGETAAIVLLCFGGPWVLGWAISRAILWFGFGIWEWWPAHLTPRRWRR